MKKHGFSLVELVLSIVVIGISLMTIPLMLGQSSKSNQYALMQESILAARTKMGNILSFKWDDNAKDINKSIIRVLDVRLGNVDLNRSSLGNIRRKGHIKESGRRRMSNFERNASLGQEVADEFNDIDDFDGESVLVAPANFGEEGKFDYVDADLNLTTIVRFISDDTNYSKQTINFDFNVSSATNDVNKSTNIKMIELNATSKNRDFPFVFRTFSSNIGQSLLYERLKK